jgi:hypothetical protein
MEKTLSLERLVVLVVVKLDFLLVSEIWRKIDVSVDVFSSRRTLRRRREVGVGVVV